jgi:hypothetical protein
MKISQKIFVVFYYFYYLVIVVNSVNSDKNDKTTCMTDYEDNDGLHFVCFCDNSVEQDVASHAESVAKDPGFSLAHFAYNLAGSYFGKAVHITFQSCRHLSLILDHMDLSRIGSHFFRPDIQVRGLVIEQVYHLELLRPPPKTADEEANEGENDEYLIAFPSESLEIQLYAVALAKVDAGAVFTLLETTSDNVRLYIDLNQGEVGDEDHLHIAGFRPYNIFFITNTKKIRMQEVRN